MDYESLLELVKKRRSIRRFKPEPIPDEYVDRIIEVARWSPSGANSQPWEFIIVKNRELKDSIVKLYEEHRAQAHRMELTREPALRFPRYAQPSSQPPGFAAAPVFIIVCGDPRTQEAYPLTATLETGSTFYSSLASTFLYMTLAATTLGLGAQWVSTIANPYMQSLAKDLLRVPRELEFYDMMAVGYHDSEPGPRLVRTREEIVHHDYYDRAKFRTDEKVTDFILALRQEQAKRPSP